MEMQVIIWGLGASLKPINMGFNIFTGAYLNFRPRSSSPVTTTIGIADSLNIGGKKGTLVYGQVKTDFFPVSLKVHPWIANLKDFIGKELDISVSGTLLVDGNVSVKLIHIDDAKNTKSLVSKDGVHAVGFQLADTMIKGKAFSIPVKQGINLSESIT